MKMAIIITISIIAGLIARKIYEGRKNKKYD